MVIFGLRRLASTLIPGVIVATLCVLGTAGAPIQATAATALRSPSKPAIVNDQSDISRVALWSLAHASNDYGGVWFDRTGGTVNVGFTRDVGNYARLLTAVVRKPADLHVLQVRRSWNSLLHTQSEIYRDAQQLRRLGVNITATGVIPEENVVSVWLKNFDAKTAAILTDRYGSDGLRIGQRDYVSFANRSNVTPPWVGGMTLAGVCQSSDCLLANCTANFTVYDFIQGVQFYYILTAGHCFTYLTHVTNGTGVPVGTVIQQFFATGVNADVEVIQESPNTHSPFIITHDPTRKGVVGSEATQNLNESVCKSGITTDETCNWTISAVHANEIICLNPPTCDQTVTLVDQLEATRSSYGIDFGDSGGPVYRYDGSGNLWGTGIVSAKNSTGTLMTYSFLANALTDVQSYLCTTGVC